MTLSWAPVGLPVEDSLDIIVEAVGPGARQRAAVITAEPGAGKSTIVPLAIAGAVEGRVVVLEPRRLAARATAERMADLLGEPRLGGVVGLTMQGVHEVGRATRIEVVTEAILTRRLQRDAELPGVDALVFDEFHERSRHSDLGLAMALETRSVLRPDLAIVVMSATIDAGPVASLLGDGAPVIDIPGRTFGVETHHLQRPLGRAWAPAMADAIERALAETTGDVLAFAPGRREIDDVLRELGRRQLHTQTVGLHGGSAASVQRSVLRPGPRRVVVASAVAETSITIPSITAVVDGGLLRRPVIDPRSGLGRLETVHATRFAADQRRGRAGRTGPGVCYRLWSAEDHRHLDDALPPEVVDGDPVPVAVELLAWGDPMAEELPLLDRPPAHRLEAAHAQLRALGALGSDNRLTARGERAIGMPVDIRAAMVAVRGTPRALDVAALLGRPDRSGSASTDLQRRLDRGLDRDAGELRRRLTKEGRRGPNGGSAARSGSEELASMLAETWPDRVGMARPNDPHRFLLACGTEVELGPNDPLVGSPFLVVAEADGRPRSDGAMARVRAAVAIGRTEVLAILADRVGWEREARWDTRSDTIVAERVQRLGAIALHREPDRSPEPAAVAAALREGLRRRGLDVLAWTDKAVATRQRLAWLHTQDDRWPDVADDALTARLDDWLDLSKVTQPKHLARLDPGKGLLDLLDWSQRAEFESLAPTALTLPGGGSARIDYSSGRPLCSVRLQKLLGLDRHPTAGPADAPITIELLTPANRPAQTTNDLPGFWRGSYSAVRADLRGRYPKHAWPADPLEP